MAECVEMAYMKSMTPVNITQAFKKCGIFPFDSDIFAEVDFLPSTVTDRPKPEVLDLTACTNIDFNSIEIPDDINNSNPQSGCSGINRNFKFPKDFLPPLKAGPRNNKQKPRKLGRSMIAKDTP